MEKSAEVTKQTSRGILDQIDKLSNIVQETVARMNEHVKHFPQYVWLSSLKITQSANDLQRITDEAGRGRMAVEPLFRLTNLRELRSLSTAHTQFLSVTRINDHTINFKFIGVIEAENVFAYKVYAFDHLDNLDSVPRRLHYTGAQYLIYNETSNCIKALSEAPDEYTGEQCVELDGEDPALNQWDIIEETENIEKYAKQPIVKKTLGYNFISCFPGNITIDGKSYRCPIEVFKLKSSHEFKTATQRHVPTYAKLNSTNELAVEVVHAGHFRDDSDVVQHLEMFETLRKERKKLREINEEMSTTFSIRRSSPLFFALITTYVGSMAFTSIYMIVTIYMRRKAAKLIPSAPRMMSPQTGPSQPEAVMYMAPNTAMGGEKVRLAPARASEFTNLSHHLEGI